MPAALIEAGLMGIPAVSTDVEAIPEIVVPGRTGELARAGSLDDFARALEAMVGDLDRARAMGRAARDHCLERFAIDRVAGDWERVISEVICRGE
jgi:glycosyltransferase involved in cell wall biosynthesis